MTGFQAFLRLYDDTTRGPLQPTLVRAAMREMSPVIQDIELSEALRAMIVARIREKCRALSSFNQHIHVEARSSEDYRTRKTILTPWRF